MDGPQSSVSAPAQEQTLRLTRLLPPGIRARSRRSSRIWGCGSVPASHRHAPGCCSTWSASADGRATLAGRSAPLSASADRELFHGLRAAVDGVLVGAGTVRKERYGRMIPDAAARRTAPPARPGGGAAGLHRLRSTCARRGHPPAERARRPGGARHSLPREPAGERSSAALRAHRARGATGPGGGHGRAERALRGAEPAVRGRTAPCLPACWAPGWSMSCSCRSRPCWPAASRRAARRCASSPEPSSIHRWSSSCSACWATTPACSCAMASSRGGRVSRETMPSSSLAS